MTLLMTYLKIFISNHVNYLNNFIQFKNKKHFISINQIKNNLGCNLIQKFQFYQQIKYFFKKCIDINCVICFFSSNFYYLKQNNLYLYCKSDNTCNSVGIIYIIYCLKCQMFYIGESSRTVMIRITEHLKCHTSGNFPQKTFCIIYF